MNGMGRIKIEMLAARSAAEGWGGENASASRPVSAEFSTGAGASSVLSGLAAFTSLRPSQLLRSAA
jgi:hypothetical protein